MITCLYEVCMYQRTGKNDSNSSQGTKDDTKVVVDDRGWSERIQMVREVPWVRQFLRSKFSLGVGSTGAPTMRTGDCRTVQWHVDSRFDSRKKHNAEHYSHNYDVFYNPLRRTPSQIRHFPPASLDKHTNCPHLPQNLRLGILALETAVIMCISHLLGGICSDLFCFCRT